MNLIDFFSIWECGLSISSRYMPKPKSSAARYQLGTSKSWFGDFDTILDFKFEASLMLNDWQYWILSAGTGVESISLLCGSLRQSARLIVLQNRSWSAFYWYEADIWVSIYLSIYLSIYTYPMDTNRLSRVQYDRRCPIASYRTCHLVMDSLHAARWSKRSAAIVLANRLIHTPGLYSRWMRLIRDQILREIKKIKYLVPGIERH